MTKKELDKIITNVLNGRKKHTYNSNYMLYERTNENLLELFNQYDVKDKEVLTVLASSDQALSCYYKGASKIDTFDKSPTTLFYFYLRKWLILYQNRLYPRPKFFENGDLELYELVCNIEPTNPDEQKAQTFWKYYLEQTNYTADQYLFDRGYCRESTPFENDIDGIKNFFNKKLSFKCFDMFTPFDIKKKYDVIILSNMLEYIPFTQSLLDQVRINIETLLKDDGIAICSYKLTKQKEISHRQEVKVLTSNNLYIDKSITCYEPLLACDKDLAYSYRLKK